MDIFPLSLFPLNSLASSVIPVVWVGMFVVCFFNLRLGWVLSGLIVPGYVVPLILIKPWSAGVIFIESCVTYFLVWFFSEYLSRRAPWSNFFGRDRFFALVLCSIFIRLLFDGWLLPIMGEWLNQALQINFDYRNHLHSFGLIIVALIANQFWKTGFVRGLVPLIVIITITALIVRYGLMELTNFNLSKIGYLYEDMASSILATPKAYIVLISTAFLASRMNLKYGWDFNGILIPSLLALQWYQPMKILATIFEAGVILLIADLLLKTPWFKKMTIEGARKLLLFFNVSFGYKIVLGYALIAWFPELKVTDYYGFGYLLSTLMAVKIHDKAILARLTRATLQTSLSSVLFATIVGYILTLLPINEFFINAIAQPQTQASANNQPVKDDLAVLLKQEEIRLYQSKVNDSFSQPLAHELETFSNAIKLLLAYRNDFDPQKLEQAGNFLEQLNYKLDIVQNRYLYLHEGLPLIGWGVYVFDLQAKSPLALSIPAPLDERGILDAGLTLFQTLGAGSLAISGSSRRAKPDLSSDVLHNQLTFFHQFHRLVNRHDSLQLRAYNQTLARQIAGSRPTKSKLGVNGLDTIIWVKHELPPSLNLIQLKQLIDQFRIDWTQPDLENQQRDLSRQGFAELILTQRAMRQLMIKPLLIQQQINYLEHDMRLEGYLQEWILNSKKLIAPKGSELYQVAAQEELLFLDEQVITPLLELVSEYSSVAGWTDANRDDLQVIGRAAGAMGYQIIHYKERQTNQQFLILTEQNNQQRYWGTYVFRLGEADNYIVQIPRPLFEINSYEFGVSLFERINAKLLMISTTHPYANLDGSSDIIASDNVRNLFNLVNQVTLRESSLAEMLVVNCRAFSYRIDQPVAQADVLFAQAKGVIVSQQIDDLSARLLATLKTDNLSVQWVDGGEQTTGYEVGGTPQAHYLKASENKGFAMLWLSPLARSGYRQQDHNTWQVAQFKSLGVESLQLSLLNYIQQNGFIDSDRDTRTIRTLLFEYVLNPDIMRLQQIILQADTDNLSLKRLVDISSKQAFLLIHNNQHQLIAVANLLPSAPSIVVINSNKNLKQQVIEYIDQRSAWLEPAKTDESL